MRPPVQIKCYNERRRMAIKDGGEAINDKINGIDFLEIYQLESSHDVGSKIAHENGRTVFFLHFFKKISDLGKDNVIIEGGVRIKDIKVEGAERADKINDYLSSAGHTRIISQDVYSNEDLRNSIKELKEDSNKVLVVLPNREGDLSTYTLRLVKKDDFSSPPENFDSILSKIDFTFKVSGYDYIDCRPGIEYSSSPSPATEPVIDYMAKDYASFRRLMLDRISQIMPKWTERSPADIGVALVELFAYVADHLSYFQDAVSTEAHLGTARRRVSLRRHARLLDYPIKEGTDARVWVFLETDVENDGLIVPRQTQLLTKRSTEDSDGTVIINEEELKRTLNGGAQCFETLHDLVLYSAHNHINFYTWGDSKCCLRSGATHATLRNDNDCLKNLKVGDVLIFEEISSAGNDLISPNLFHRQAVRLTEVKPNSDTLYNPPVPVVDIRWMSEDALTFSFCLNTNNLDQNQGQKEAEISYTIARGNTVLADHGYTVYEFLGTSPNKGKFYPRLSLKPLTFAGQTYLQSLSAHKSINYDLQEAIPAISIIEVRRIKGQAEEEKLEQNTLLSNNEFEIKTRGDSVLWNFQQDLLKGNEFEAAFVTEIENDSTVYIRFGDGKYCRKPLNSTAKISYLYYAKYRVGNGLAGNVGAESISRIYSQSPSINQKSILNIRNPIAAQNGTEPETIEEIRQFASESILTVDRAVTEDDCVNLLERHPEVNKAIAVIRWTGSWYTVTVAVNRQDGQQVDEDFKSQIRNYLDQFRLAGYDIEVASPSYIPLDIRLEVTIKSEYFRNEVRQTLLELFSNRDLGNGKKGFFHPDNLNFGQPILYGRIYEVAIKVAGVISLKLERFRRWDQADNGEINQTMIEMALYEIPRLDNDSDYPENGTIEFDIVYSPKQGEQQ